MNGTRRRQHLRRAWLAFAILALAAASAMAQSRGPIPTPESVLGYRVGADFKLASYDDAIRYLRLLEKASNRLRLVEIGRTSEGRAWHMALISSPANLARIERLREISQRLAHPEGLSDEEARRLAREGRPFVHIDGGLHSTEVAGGQHAIQLAYDLVASAGDPRMQTILDNVVLQLWPSLNPDGQNMVVDWYRGNVGTKFEIAPLPRLYQKYVGHDNNRDAYMLNMIESRVVERVWRHWEPQITYVQHQSSPFPTRIWLPPFAEPIATQVSPLMSRTVNAIGMVIAVALEERGQVGATHMGSGFDAWYPGYIDYMPMLQNRAAFWTETALYRYATPHHYTLADFPKEKAALRSESLYPSPWKGGWWRLRDAVDYMLTASIAVLDYAAKYRENVLYNRYQAGRDAIRKYADEPPYAYLIPQEQRDPAAPVELLRRLAFNGVRVAQLTRPMTSDGETWPAGTWVIPMNQEYAELARQVLDEQRYPDLREYPEGPPDQPYDAAGWTLPLQMGVRVSRMLAKPTAEMRAAWKPVQGAALDWKAAAEKGEPDAAPFVSAPGIGFDTDPVAAGIVPLPGRRSGAGPALLLDPAQNNAFRAINMAWQAGGTVQFAAAGPGGEPRYVVSGVPEATQSKWVESLALRAEAGAPGGTTVPAPRIAVYHPWTASMDEGWCRWILDMYKFRYAELTNAMAREGRLRERFDVILIADERGRSMMEGFAEGTVPPQFVGGLGEAGARALDLFVREGGTLVCLNRSSDFAISALRLPVRNVVAGLPRRDFFMGGSLLGVEVDAAHPVMAGMPAQPAVFCESGPVFAPADGFQGSVLARYPGSGTPLLSGYLLGEKSLQGQAAALDVRHGNGHVLLLGFRPQWRGQSFGTFRILFNAMLYHGELAGGARGASELRRAP